MTLAPDPVTKYRETVPPALAQVVMKCLEKKAADRWQSAGELLPLLEALVTPSGGVTPTDTRPVAATAARRRWLVRLGVAAVAVLVVGGFLAVRFLRVGGPGTLIGQEVLAEHDLILVVEFQNSTDDSLLGATVSDAIRVELQQSGVVRVLGQEDMWRGLRRMGMEPGGENREGVARELAEREGAKAYVTGDVSRLGSGYQLTARVLATLDESVVHTERVTAEDDRHLIEAVDDLGKQLRRSIGEPLRAVRAAPELDHVTTASLPALRAFSAAGRAEFSGQRRRAINLLREAVALDTAFAGAWSRLGVLYHNNDDYRQAAEAVSHAYTFLDRLPERERLRVAGAYHSFRDEFALAEAAYYQLLELEGESSFALDNLADNMLNMHRWSEAESLSLRGIQVDPQSITSYWNAVEAQVAQRSFAAADSVLSLMAVHLPDHPWLRSLQSRVTFARRDFDAAEAYLDSVWADGPPQVTAALRLYSCGLKLYRGRLGEWRQCGYEGPGAALWELRYAGDTARVSGMVDSMLASESRDYPGLVTVLAEMGRLPEAYEILGEWQDAFGPDDLGYRTEVGRAAGSIALAEGRPDSAVNAFLAWHRAGYVGASHIFNRGLAEAANAHDQAGRPDSAIALYERALNIPSIWGAAYEAIWYPHALRRLGELHESLGHREAAVEYYGMFVDLWKDADPELQPQVEDVRRRIARLMGEPQP